MACNFADYHVLDHWFMNGYDLNVRSVNLEANLCLLKTFLNHYDEKHVPFVYHVKGFTVRYGAELFVGLWSNCNAGHK